MAIWNKPPQVNPAQIAQLQARIDADPIVQQFRTVGYRMEGDPWRRDPKSGRVLNPDQLADYIKTTYPLPEGYGASQQGQVVYTNETPILRQAALASLPITIPMGINAIIGAAGAGGAAAGAGASASAGGTLGPATAIPGLHAAVPGALTTGGNLAGVGAATGGAGLLTAGNDAINGAIDRGGSPPLGGITPPRDLASRASDWFKDPRNLVGLASIVPSLIAARGGGNSASTDAAMNQANRMSAITEARMRRVDPLHQAVTQLAFGRLPVSSRNGVTLTNVPLPE